MAISPHGTIEKENFCDVLGENDRKNEKMGENP
jgi:hypothetical protein